MANWNIGLDCIQCVDCNMSDLVTWHFRNDVFSKLLRIMVKITRNLKAMSSMFFQGLYCSGQILSLSISVKWKNIPKWLRVFLILASLTHRKGACYLQTKRPHNLNTRKIHEKCYWWVVACGDFKYGNWNDWLNFLSYCRQTYCFSWNSFVPWNEIKNEIKNSAWLIFLEQALTEQNNIFF